MSSTTIDDLVRRLDRRKRAQKSVAWAVSSLGAACVILACTVILQRMGWCSTATVEFVAIMGLLVTTATILLALVRSHDRVALAISLDDSHALHDRLGTALELIHQRRSLSDFERMQVQDAIRVVPNVNITSAAPWGWPKTLPWAVLAGVLLLASHWLPLPERAVDAPVATTAALELGLLAPAPAPIEPQAPESVQALPPEPEVLPEPLLDSEDEAIRREATMQAQENVNEQLQLTQGDPQAMDALKKLNRALSALAASGEELGPRELVEKANEAQDAVEQLSGSPKQQAMEQALEDKLNTVANALREKTKTPTSKRTPPSKKALDSQLKSFADALDKREYERAATTLERMMDSFPNLDRREQKRLAKTFEALGKKFESRLQKEMDRLRKERERLRRKNEDSSRLSKRERSRLNRAEKQLDRLERQRQTSQPEHEKQLDKLSKDMRDLADRMRRQREQQPPRGQPQDKDQPEQRKQRMKRPSAKELSEMLRRMEKRRKQRRAGQRLKMKMADMRELLQRRRRRMQRGRKRLEQLAKQKTRGAEKDTKNQPRSMQPSDESGDDDGLMMRQQREGRQRWSRRRNDGDNGAGRTRQQMLAGSETELEGAQMLEDFVPGKEGKGPTAREILYGASASGPRVKGYGEVHLDYSMRASRQMEEERIPAGYRDYVERYFELIRKR